MSARLGMAYEFQEATPQVGSSRAAVRGGVEEQAWELKWNAVLVEAEAYLVQGRQLASVDRCSGVFLPFRCPVWPFSGATTGEGQMWE